jgi:hypothetical protein
MGANGMTIIVDTDNDGTPDAVFPLKWVILVITSLVTVITATVI